jgi:hypothetical protein
VIADQVVEAVGQWVEQARADAAAVAVGWLLGFLSICHGVAGFLSMRIVRMLQKALCGNGLDLRGAARSMRRRGRRFAGFAAAASAETSTPTRGFAGFAAFASPE